MKKVFVYGSINYDLVINSDRFPKKGETITGKGFYTNSGGKGANQAVASSKLGAKTYLIGAIGNDSFGDECLEAIKKYQVDTSFVRVVPINTGCAIIVVSENDNSIILDKGANYHYDQCELEKIILENVSSGDIFLTQLETPLESVKIALKAAKEKGAVTILNPAPAQVISEDIYKEVDIIIPNECELQDITSEKEIEKAVEVLYNKGVGNVIVTLGNQGCYFNHKIYPPIPAAVIDTTCAGDTFIGALAYQLALGKSIVSSLDLCQIASSITVTRKGAQQSIPTIEELMQKFEEE